MLDLGLPDLDGVEVIHGLRGWTRVPIIVLSGRASSHDKIEALEAGADNYVTKPFNIAELVARIRAVTRRAGPENSQSVVTVGNCTLNLADKTATDTNGHTLRLTPTEWHLLEILLRNPGKLISQQLRWVRLANGGTGCLMFPLFHGHGGRERHGSTTV